jgi:hypothetical protein
VLNAEGISSRANVSVASVGGGVYFYAAMAVALVLAVLLFLAWRARQRQQKKATFMRKLGAKVLRGARLKERGVHLGSKERVLQYSNPLLKTAQRKG